MSEKKSFYYNFYSFEWVLAGVYSVFVTLYPTSHNQQNLRLPSNNICWYTISGCMEWFGWERLFVSQYGRVVFRCRYFQESIGEEEISYTRTSILELGKVRQHVSRLACCIYIAKSTITYLRAVYTNIDPSLSFFLKCYLQRLSYLTINCNPEYILKQFRSSRSSASIQASYARRCRPKSYMQSSTSMHIAYS